MDEFNAGQGQAKQQCRLLQEKRIFIQPNSNQGHTRLSHGSSQEKTLQKGTADYRSLYGSGCQWPDVA